MLKPPQIEELARKVYELLSNVGIVVENDDVTNLCIQKGCSQGLDHRLKIPRQIINEMVQFQKKTQEQYERDHGLVLTCGSDWAHHLMWTRTQHEFRRKYKTQFLMQAFDCGPTTIYDHPSGSVKPVNRQVFETMLKFAQATPEIGYTSMWYRQNLPPPHRTHRRPPHGHGLHR